MGKLVGMSISIFLSYCALAIWLFSSFWLDCMRIYAWHWYGLRLYFLPSLFASLPIAVAVWVYFDIGGYPSTRVSLKRRSLYYLSASLVIIPIIAVVFAGPIQYEYGHRTWVSLVASALVLINAFISTWVFLSIRNSLQRMRGVLVILCTSGLACSYALALVLSRSFRM